MLFSSEFQNRRKKEALWRLVCWRVKEWRFGYFFFPYLYKLSFLHIFLMPFKYMYQKFDNFMTTKMYKITSVGNWSPWFSTWRGKAEVFSTVRLSVLALGKSSRQKAVTGRAGLSALTISKHTAKYRCHFCSEITFGHLAIIKKINK